MPELRAFEVLLAIARTGSLGAAGRELGLSQQTVSARVASLEKLTSVRLVVRSARGSQLSSAGLVVAEWAEHLIGVAERVDTGIATLREQGRNRVRVAASLTVAEQLMPRWLVSMQNEANGRGGDNPHVTLTAMSSSLVVRAVQENEADVGFIEGPNLPKGLHGRVVAHDELVVIVPPSHKWARRSALISAEEVRLTPMVLPESDSGTRESFTAALQDHFGRTVVHAAPVLELSSVTAIRAAVLAGAGPAVISRLSAVDDLALGRLKAIGVADLDLRRRIRAIWMGDRIPPAGAVRDLISHISRQNVSSVRS